MIAVDTSALMAVVMDEPQSARCISVIESEEDVLLPAGTVAEALILAITRNVMAEMSNLIQQLGFEIVPVTTSSAMRIAQICALWGKGSNSAELSFGDRIAYDIAKQNDCPLLFVGEGFFLTDLRPASDRQGQ